MSRLLRLGRAAGSVGAALGVAAAGAAVGFTAERYVVGRSLRGDDPYADEDFGSLRGTAHHLRTDDGVDLHVEVDEAAAPVTVVFTHGYALNHDSWHFQRRDLAGTARLVFWDQRSHGRSMRAPEDSITIERLGRDLGEVLDATVPRGPVVLAGHSMGGMTILALAAGRPQLFGDRVAGVALIATSARDLGAVSLGLPGPLGRLTHKVAPGVVAALARRPELIERGRRAGSDLGYVLTRRYSFVESRSASLIEFTAAMNAATPIEVLADFLPLFSGHDGRASLPVLARVPVLVVGAVGDLLAPVEHSRELADALPDASYVEVPDAGHMVILERHDVVTAHLRELVDRITAELRPAAARVSTGRRWWRRR
ncbi:MAG TPA: alpha/beta hydrolase [Jiangellaceae bacterium]